MTLLKAKKTKQHTLKSILSLWMILNYPCTATEVDRDWTSLKEEGDAICKTFDDRTQFAQYTTKLIGNRLEKRSLNEIKNDLIRDLSVTKIEEIITFLQSIITELNERIKRTQQNLDELLSKGDAQETLINDTIQEQNELRDKLKKLQSQPTQDLFKPIDEYLSWRLLKDLVEDANKIILEFETAIETWEQCVKQAITHLEDRLTSTEQMIESAKKERKKKEELLLQIHAILLVDHKQKPNIQTAKAHLSRAKGESETWGWDKIASQIKGQSKNPEFKEACSLLFGQEKIKKKEQTAKRLQGLYQADAIDHLLDEITYKIEDQIEEETEKKKQLTQKIAECRSKWTGQKRSMDAKIPREIAISLSLYPITLIDNQDIQTCYNNVKDFLFTKSLLSTATLLQRATEVAASIEADALEIGGKAYQDFVHEKIEVTLEQEETKISVPTGGSLFIGLIAQSKNYGRYMAVGVLIALVLLLLFSKKWIKNKQNQVVVIEEEEDDDDDDPIYNEPSFFE